MSMYTSTSRHSTLIKPSRIHEVKLRCTAKREGRDHGTEAPVLLDRNRDVIVFGAASAQEAVSIAQDSVRLSTVVVLNEFYEYVVQSSDLISVVPLQEAVITPSSLLVEAP